MKYVVKIVHEVKVDTSNKNAALIAAHELVNDIIINEAEFDDVKYGVASAFGEFLGYEEHSYVDRCDD